MFLNACPLEHLARRVSPAFMVIALGLPTPRFAGAALDPPLRSRFQARAAKTPPSLH